MTSVSSMVRHLQLQAFHIARLDFLYAADIAYLCIVPEASLLVYFIDLISFSLVVSLQVDWFFVAKPS